MGSRLKIGPGLNNSSSTLCFTVLGVDQADVSKITQGRSTGFSLRRLVRLLNRLDRDVELVVKPSRAKGRATFVVRAA